jgi:hypothetical protein
MAARTSATELARCGAIVAANSAALVVDQMGEKFGPFIYS